MSNSTTTTQSHSTGCSFATFATEIDHRLNSLHNIADGLFVVDSDKDVICKTYLEAFPEGTNQLFRTRTEHDCSTCKSFLRNAGSIVGIVEGRIRTIWDPDYIPESCSFYRDVAAALHEYVASLPIRTVFRTPERSFGKEVTYEQTDLAAIVWKHFHWDVPPMYRTAEVGFVQGNAITRRGVFSRGLQELSAAALQEVSELIDAKSIYRGQEFAFAVRDFLQLKQEYDNLRTVRDRELFTWAEHMKPNTAFLNTAIGTLVSDLSTGMGVEAAVRSFEAKVAPTNYKRPTAVISPAMVKAAAKTIEENGLESALHRRLAKLSDVAVNDVLFVDNEVRPAMRGGVADLLMDQVKPKRTTRETADATDISIEDFVANVLPTAVSAELLVSNEMLGNFVSLTAPQHEDAARLFKWDNNFAWSYDGNVTDSIKQRVKQAGGNVNTMFRTSLAWFNKDDLDIHMHGPTGLHVYFGRKQSGIASLDVDMNVSNPTRTPVENICWNSVPYGEYKILVHNFCKRESIDVGFVLEVEEAGKPPVTYRYDKAVGHMLPCLRVVSSVEGITVSTLDPYLRVADISHNKWGVTTGQFSKIDLVTLSPNHWHGQSIGNKHWFFILRDCKNPEPTRGIYNEFLSSNLETHRKVFEILGDKTKCPVVDEQLSGVGFSSTQKNSAVVAVTTSKTRRLYKISFGG